MVYSSENDCICPAKTIGDYCKRQGIPFEMMGGFEQYVASSLSASGT